MAAVLSILTLIVLFKAILGLWIVWKAFDISFGWFVFLLVGGVVGSAAGPLGQLLTLGALLVFVAKYWHQVRTPVLLYVAASLMHTVVVVQTGRTLQQQAAQATEQAR